MAQGMSRDDLISDLARKGMSSRAIAPVVGISDRRVRQIVQSRWERPSHVSADVTVSDEAVVRTVGANSGPSRQWWELRPAEAGEDPVTVSVGVPNDEIQVQIHVPGGWESMTPIRARALAVILTDAADAADAAGSDG